MRAIKTNAGLQFDTDYPEPKPAGGEVLLKVLKAGICNTDLEIVKGYMGFTGVLGHEWVGRAQGGPLDGQRVAGEINCACRQCETCLRGVPSQCPNRVTIGINKHDGAFADWVSVPQANLHAIPDAVTDDQAVFVEPLAAALQILAMTRIEPTDRVVLLGTGKLGLLCTQVAALTGCVLTAVSRHEHQRELLKKWNIDSAAPGEVEHRRADMVIDCTGTEQGFADALDLVRPRGEIHLKSTFFGMPQANLTRVVVDEVRITTSRCGPFNAAIRLLDRGLVDVASLVEAHYPLDDGLAAFEDASQRGRLKVILDVSS